MKKFLYLLIILLSTGIFNSCDIEEVELIVNGDFESGALAPGWVSCAPLAGGVVDGGPCFITEYQLTLKNNDCVRQTFDRENLVSSDLTFWYHRGIEEYQAQLIVTVRYTDNTSSSITLSNYYTDCKKGTVVTDKTKQVSSVQFRTVNASQAWYITLISLRAYVEVE